MKLVEENKWTSLSVVLGKKGHPKITRQRRRFVSSFSLWLDRQHALLFFYFSFDDGGKGHRYAALNPLNEYVCVHTHSDQVKLEWRFVGNLSECWHPTLVALPTTDVVTTRLTPAMLPVNLLLLTLRRVLILVAWMTNLQFVCVFD